MASTSWAIYITCLLAIEIIFCFRATGAPLKSEKAFKVGTIATKYDDNTTEVSSKQLLERQLPSTLSAKDFQQYQSIGMALTNLCLINQTEAETLLGAETRVKRLQKMIFLWKLQELSLETVDVARYRPLFNYIQSHEATATAQSWAPYLMTRSNGVRNSAEFGGVFSDNLALAVISTYKDARETNAPLDEYSVARFAYAHHYLRDQLKNFHRPPGTITRKTRHIFHPFRVIVFDDLSSPHLLEVIQKCLDDTPSKKLPPTTDPITYFIGQDCYYMLLGLEPGYEVAWSLITRKFDVTMYTVDSISISASTTGDPDSVTLVFTIKVMRDGKKFDPRVRTTLDGLKAREATAYGLAKVRERENAALEPYQAPSIYVPEKQITRGYMRKHEYPGFQGGKEALAPQAGTQDRAFGTTAGGGHRGNGLESRPAYQPGGDRSERTGRQPGSNDGQDREAYVAHEPAADTATQEGYDGRLSSGQPSEVSSPNSNVYGDHAGAQPNRPTGTGDTTPASYFASGDYHDSGARYQSESFDVSHAQGAQGGYPSAGYDAQTASYSAYRASQPFYGRTLIANYQPNRDSCAPGSSSICSGPKRQWQPSDDPEADQRNPKSQKPKLESFSTSLPVSLRDPLDPTDPKNWTPIDDSRYLIANHFNLDWRPHESNRQAAEQPPSGDTKAASGRARMTPEDNKHMNIQRIEKRLL